MRDNIAEKIIVSLPIKRFRELRQIEGVGKQTYNELFKILYLQSKNTVISQKFKDSSIEKNITLKSPEILRFTINFQEDYDSFNIMWSRMESVLKTERKAE